MKRAVLLTVFIHLIYFLSAAPEANLKKAAFNDAAPITDGFITRWETTTDNQQILIPIQSQYAAAYDYTVDWGDGQKSSNQTGDATHVYASKGAYTVTITGSFPAIDFGSGTSTGTNSGLITSVIQWGNGTWEGMDGSFFSCIHLTTVPNDKGPIFAPHSTLYSMFYGCSSLNCDLDKWDLSNVRETSEMFHGCTAFNGKLSGWNVSNVANMEYMFYMASSFNQDISGWDVSSDTLMNNMFAYATSFNQDISNWDVSSVQTMNSMFAMASSYNQNISNWDLASVTNLSSMFYGATAFDQNLGQLDISNVTNMAGMLSLTGMSPANYEATLSGWAGQTVQNNIKLGAEGLHYCDNSGHRILENNYGWTFNGDRQACLVPAVPDGQGIVYVDSAVAVPGNGSSWSSALKYLSNATESANINTDITAIHVAKGSYYATGDKNSTFRDSSFNITRSNLKLLGGYPSGGGERDMDINPTVLSGNLGDPNSMMDNTSDILYIANIPKTDSVIIDGFIISGSAALDNDLVNQDKMGAAITISGCYANTVLRNSQVINNTSVTASGLVITGYAVITDPDDVNIGNLPNPQIINCLFKENAIVASSDGSYGTIAGTLAILAASPYFNHCDFINNAGNMTAGSISYLWSRPVFNHCNFTDNHAGSFPVSLNYAGSASTYVNCLMKNNIIEGVDPTTTPSELQNINNAIIGNVQFASTSLINCSVVNNKSLVSPASADPLLINIQESASYITNSIIWGNTGKSILDVANTTVSSKPAYSLIEGMAADPTTHMLDGTGNAQIFVDANSDFQLSTGSAAIDQGLNDSLTVTLAAYLTGATNGGSDFAGNQRIANSIIDLGAYEFNAGGLPVKSGDLAGKVNESGHAVLNWTTYSETGNQGFYIQQSNDGVQFTNQGFVASKAINGMSQSALNYNYDAGVVSKVTYYRLMQVDQNGAKSVSNVIRLEVNAPVFKLLAYPNPVQNKLHLKIQGESAENAQVVLMDFAGKVLRQMKLTSTDSYMDLQGLSAGVYMLHYKDAKRSSVIKIVKQ